MKHYLLLCIIFSMITKASAQLGISASTTLNRSVEWQVVTENFVVHRKADFMHYGTSGVIDYAFSFQNEKIRLRPAIQGMFVNSVYQKHYFQASSIGFQGNLEFALSSKTDKEGKKKLIRPYFQVSPGISLVSLRYEYPKDDLNNVILVNKSRNVALNIGTGLFFEMKLTPLLSLAPTVGFRFYPKLRWNNFTKIVTKGMLTETYDSVNWKQLNFGLRFGLNFK
ncbi:MAG: hypothetical protein GC192_09515 [Bacteroidetes bacterium]|nr:hypothetical protein [Bacteroidota bacterium]